MSKKGKTMHVAMGGKEDDDADIDLGFEYDEPSEQLSALERKLKQGL